MLGILKLKAKDVIGFTVTQLVVHFPLVLFLLWFFGRTLSYTLQLFNLVAPLVYAKGKFSKYTNKRY